MATADTKRQLSTDKALRIVDAMRSSVARRGVAGSTFDHVAREAGVSRGLLHYYFATKERLLVEVAKRDSQVRLEAMSAELQRASNTEELVALWVRSLYATVKHEPEFVSMLLELYTLAQRTPEIAAELASVNRGMSDAFAARLRLLVDEGRIVIDDSPETIAAVLNALGNGLALRFLSTPNDDMQAAVDAASRAARVLLRDGPGA